MFDQAGLIGQVDMYTMIRFRIENRTITPNGKLQLIVEQGKRVEGSVFMRGTFLYVYGKDGIYKRKL